MCRKGRILDELLDTITRPNDRLDRSRAEWLCQHPDPRVRKYAAYLSSDTDDQERTESRLAD